jgi:hypothetical protein
MRVRLLDHRPQQQRLMPDQSIGRQACLLAILLADAYRGFASQQAAGTCATSATADSAHPSRSGIPCPALVAACRAILGSRSGRLLFGQAVQLNAGELRARFWRPLPRGGTLTALPDHSRPLALTHRSLGAGTASALRGEAGKSRPRRPCPVARPRARRNSPAPHNAIISGDCVLQPARSPSSMPTAAMRAPQSVSACIPLLVHGRQFPDDIADGDRARHLVSKTLFRPGIGNGH